MEDKKTNLKIAFLSRYSGTVNRGVETYVLELSKRLKNWFEVDVLSGSDCDNLSKIIKGKYDIVIPTNGRLQSLKASFGRVVGHYRTIISGQAGIGRDDLWNIAITRPNYYVAITQFEKEWAKKWAWNSKLSKINNGVDLEKFSPSGSKIDFNLQKPIILSVGALEWYKHHERTIKAMAYVKKGSLVIMGVGSEQEKLQKMGMSLLGEKRFLITKATFLEMPKYYRSADIFVLPSWIRESFGIVYVEAMASGLPVVAPDDPPRREIVGEAGLFTDVCNPQVYGQKITEAYQKKWGSLPTLQAEKFSWDKIAQQYKELFEGMY